MKDYLVIEKFIENWKIEAIKWAEKTKADYQNMREEVRKEKEEGKINIHQYFNKIENWRMSRGITKFLKNEFDFNGNISELYEKEAKRKYNQFISKIEKKTGKVLDANLYIAEDGNINGVIRGEKEVFSVTTILAGGYNIQCLHYRILIK